MNITRISWASGAPCCSILGDQQPCRFSRKAVRAIIRIAMVE